MIRPAKKTDAEQFVPILMQILNDMELDVITEIGNEKIQALLAAAFEDPYYRYGYQQTLVYVNDQTDQVQGICVGYPAAAEATIDDTLRPYLKLVGIPEETQLFTDVETKPGEWYLDSLAVAPDAQKQGIGGQLLDYLPNYLRAKGEHTISLNVDFGNAKAKHLYVHHGFISDGELMIGSHRYEHLIQQI
ncbi:GNAT family N-acetyltransferase [Lapidilactobacillus bayanensis]|uniref:GNAT family N-acetyltransferase n=1 Tax=Lapidilactobacillus bayanensis TaxID=2485998 RepID=UPI000F7737E6|nr:GNAT family N-acetyltransferase [Lapidilactobacillus bayanensis]